MVDGIGWLWFYLQFGLKLMENSSKYETMHSTTIDI
jgi:hypothetical protein